MNDFLAVAFRACDPMTVVTVAVIGFALGAIYLRAITRRAGLTVLSMVVLGSSFFAFACVSRALQGVVVWPAWIGVWVLWLVFSAGAYVAIRLER